MLTSHISVSHPVCCCYAAHSHHPFFKRIFCGSSYGYMRQLLYVLQGTHTTCRLPVVGTRRLQDVHAHGTYLRHIYCTRHSSRLPLLGTDWCRICAVHFRTTRHTHHTHNIPSTLPLPLQHAASSLLRVAVPATRIHGMDNHTA